MEQFIHAEKATLFNDDETHSKIMNATSPAVCKSLGKRVKNFVPQRWEQEAGSIAYRGVLAKYSQNPLHKKRLLDTGNKKLGEASKDKLWGVGMSLRDPGLLYQNRWTGANILGVALERARDTLRARESSVEEDVAPQGGLLADASLPVPGLMDVDRWIPGNNMENPWMRGRMALRRSNTLLNMGNGSDNEISDDDDTVFPDFP